MADGTAVSVETSLAQSIIDLDARRKELNEQLDDVTKQRGEAQRALLALWESSGTTQQRINGRLVHLRRDVYAGTADRAALVAWLEGNDFGDLVSVNTQTLSAWVKEQFASDDPAALPVLPDDLAGLININESYSIRTRN